MLGVGISGPCGSEGVTVHLVAAGDHNEVTEFFGVQDKFWPFLGVVPEVKSGEGTASVVTGDERVVEEVLSDFFGCEVGSGSTALGGSFSGDMVVHAVEGVEQWLESPNIFFGRSDASVLHLLQATVVTSLTVHQWRFQAAGQADHQQ